MTDLNVVSRSEAKKLLKELAEKLAIYNKAYFEDDAPLVSDAEYDQLFQLNLALEAKFPYLAVKNRLSEKVGNIPSEKFSKVTHSVPMLSLGNAFNMEDVEDFIYRIKSFLRLDKFEEIFCEPKIDGLSFSVIYDQGFLKTAATRGDGFVGEDITANIKTIANLPHIIINAPALLEVRGEVYIDKADFIELNRQQEQLGKDKFANPRNAAAGSLRQLDANITKSRPLKYFIYAIGSVSETLADNQQSLLARLKEFGFMVNEVGRLAGSAEEINSFYEYLKLNREQLPYEIDGVVYKLNDFAKQQRMGFIARSPRFAIAHKFPAIIGKTKLLNITIQVGRTGALTPVAELEPIAIGGVIVSRATLHNYQEIARKDIRINDYVFLQRAGDVIPQIIGVDLPSRADSSLETCIPKECPSCGSHLHYDPEAVAIRCDNGLNCPAQNCERICHFVSRDAMDIDGLGKKQIEFLLQKVLITNPVDIFYLQEKNTKSFTKLENMPGWGQKSVENLFINIEKAKDVSLPRFIYSLGIKHIGAQNAKLLALQFKNYRDFLNSMRALAEGNQEIYQLLNNLEGIGDKILIDIINFFDITENFEIVDRLSQILNIADYNQQITQSILTGKIIIFTGSMVSLSRAEAKSQAEKLGAKVAASVSSVTNLIIAGSDAGSKLKKAKELGIKIIDEDEWLAIVNSQIN